MDFCLNSVPPFIRDKYKKKIREGCFEGSVLFVDISGFTALTEKLLKLGDRGVEEISRIVFNVFDPQIEAVFESGGFVSYFAGDAFMAVFENDSGGKALSAERKIRALLELNNFEALPDNGCRLDAHFSGGTGEIQWGMYSTPKKNMFYFKGKAFENAFSGKKGFGASRNQDSSALFFPDFSKDQIDQNILILFEEKEVLKISSAPEIRNILSFFLQFEGFDTHEEISAVGAFTSEKAALFGGILNKLIFCDKGLTALVFFGAPLALESPEEKALSFASEFRDKFKSIFPDKRWKGGSTRGPVYSGLTGGGRCNEWTALGDSVNTASRLMSLSNWGSLTVSEKIVKKSSSYAFSYGGLAELKGKESAQSIFFFEGKNLTMPEEKKTPFINRVREKRWLESCLLPLSEKRFGGLNCLTGESGLGKTRLMDEVRKESGLEWVNLFCKGHLNKAFYPVTMWLRTFFSLSDDDDFSSFKLKMMRVLSERKAEIEEISEEIFFLASLADIPVAGGIFEESNPKLRVEKQISSFKSLLRLLSAANPLVLFIDDMQFSDELTAELVVSMSRNMDEMPLTVIISSWPNYFEKNKTFEGVKFNSNFTMKGIPDDEIYMAVVKRITDYHPTDRFIDLLREKAKNIPLFCEQLVLHLKETDSLSMSPEGLCGVKEGGLKIPSEIGDLLTERLDRLDTDVREALKHASILGIQFEESVFRNLLFKSASFNFDMDKNYLFKAKEEGLLEDMQGELQEYWFFRSPILRDISYKLQLPSVRKELHEIAAESIRKIHADNIPSFYDDLIYHFREAGQTENETKFLRAGAERAEQRYENKKAITYHLRFAELISQKDESGKVNELFETFRKIGYIYSVIGDYQTALSFYEKALALAVSLGEWKKTADVSISMGDLYKNIGEFQSAEKYLENAREQAEKTGEEVLLGEIYNIFGMLKCDLSEFDTAYECFQKALRLLEGNETVKLKALVLTNIGLLFSQSGFRLKDDAKAIELTLEALELSRKTDSKRNTVNALNNLAVFYAQKGDFHKSRNFFEQLIILLESIGDFNRKGIINNNIAYLYAEFLQEKEKAAKHYVKSFECFEEISDEAWKLATFMSVLELVLAEGLKEYADWISRKIHYLNFSKIEKLSEEENEKFRKILEILEGNVIIPEKTTKSVALAVESLLSKGR